MAYDKLSRSDTILDHNRQMDRQLPSANTMLMHSIAPVKTQIY